MFGHNQKVNRQRNEQRAFPVGGKTTRTRTKPKMEAWQK
jgi:hypothetical protein